MQKLSLYIHCSNKYIQDSLFYFITTQRLKKCQTYEQLSYLLSFASTFDVKCVSKNCTNGPNPNALTKVPSPTIPPAR